jgi:hypothetical protein
MAASVHRVPLQDLHDWRREVRADVPEPAMDRGRGAAEAAAAPPGARPGLVDGRRKLGGDVQVSAATSRDDHCYVGGWSQQTTPAIDVACTTAKGALVSVPFTVQWVVP